MSLSVKSSILFLILLLFIYFPSSQQGGGGEPTFQSSGNYHFPEKENQSIYNKLVEYLKNDYQHLAMPVCISTEEVESIYNNNNNNNATGNNNNNNNHRRTTPPKPLHVSMDMWLFRLFGLDGPTQALTIDTWIEMSWHDCALEWDPKNFSNIQQITLPSDEIWRPDIINYQSLHGNYEEGLYIFGAVKARVRFDGQVQLGGQLVHRSFCRLDMKEFPFDSQICNITFASWNKDSSVFQLTKRGGDVHDSKGHSLVEASNGEWEIISFSSFNSESFYRVGTDEEQERAYSEVTFQLKLKRKPTYAQMYLIFPCFVLYWLAAITFILPVECGEKISLCITVLLSQIVFLLLLADNVPRTASRLPILGLFYFLSIILVLFSIFCTTLVLNVGYKPNTIAMPKTLENFLMHPIMKNICFCSKKKKKKNSKEEMKEEEEDENAWRRMATLMDRAFFLLYLFFAVGLSIYILSFF